MHDKKSHSGFLLISVAIALCYAAKADAQKTAPAEKASARGAGQVSLTREQAIALRKTFDDVKLLLPQVTELDSSAAEVLVCNDPTPKKMTRHVKYTVLVDKADATGGVKKVPEIRSREISFTMIGFKLGLDGLKRVTEDTAKVLATHQGDLSLNGLQEISPDVATSLSRHKGQLFLDGLTAIDKSSAKALSRHTGEISLRGLKSPPKDVVDALSPAVVELE